MIKHLFMIRCLYCSQIVVEMYNFVYNLVNYLYYRGHPYDETR